MVVTYIDVNQMLTLYLPNPNISYKYDALNHFQTRTKKKKIKKTWNRKKCQAAINMYTGEWRMHFWTGQRWQRRRSAYSTPSLTGRSFMSIEAMTRCPGLTKDLWDGFIRYWHKPHFIRIASECSTYRMTKDENGHSPMVHRTGQLPHTGVRLNMV